jgi:hypothetical protein
MRKTINITTQANVRKCAVLGSEIEEVVRNALMIVSS